MSNIVNTLVAQKVILTGASPLLMHSTRGMNKMDPLVKEMRALVKKPAKQKTDEDEIEIQRMEFELGMYRHDGRPVIPADLLLGTLRDGAKAQRLGKEVERSVFLFDDHLKLEYTGPTGVDEMWADGRFADVRSVKVGQSRVMRTRPIFHDWKITATVHFDTDHLDADAFRRAFDTAGQRVGLGDYRPRYGRFGVQYV